MTTEQQLAIVRDLFAVNSPIVCHSRFPANVPFVGDEPKIHGDFTAQSAGILPTPQDICISLANVRIASTLIKHHSRSSITQTLESLGIRCRSDEAQERYYEHRYDSKSLPRARNEGEPPQRRD